MDFLDWNRLKGQLTVAMVIVLILFISYSSQVFVIWPYLSPLNFHSISILVPLNFFVAMVLVNYILTCSTNPGSVPDRWLPRQQAFIEVKKSTHSPRFCKACNNHKPPRTHHCSSCNRCVLKMDHHCPWINNCVGFRNYCHFFRFLVYVDITTIYIIVLLSCRLAQLIKEMRIYDIRPSPLETVFISINMFLSSAVLFGVGVLTVYHVYCITTNTTTIEGWEKGRSLTIKGMGKIQNVKCPYDQGIYKNIGSVLGYWPIFWFVPQPMVGDGLDFPISMKYLDSEVEEKVTSKRQYLSSVPLARHDSTVSLTREESVTSLNRYSTMQSEWSAVSNYQEQKLDEKPTRIYVAPVLPIKTKQSMTGIGHLSTNVAPNTPGSILTFASNTTTLVDYHHYQQSNTTKSPTNESQHPFSF